MGAQQIPVWDYKKCFGYENHKDPLVSKKLEAIEASAKAFEATYAGKLTEKLGDALKEYSAFSMDFEDFSAFVGAYKSTHEADADVQSFYSSFMTKCGMVQASYTEWFELEIMKMDGGVLADWLERSDVVREHKRYIDLLMERKEHALSLEIEKALTLRESWYGTQPVKQFFLEELTKAQYEFANPVTGAIETLDESQLLTHLMNRDWRIREEALKCFNSGLATHQLHKFSCLSLNAVAGKLAIENAERKYKSIRQAQNMANHVSEAVVQALIHAVKTKGVELNRRFYKLKKRILTAKTGRADFTWADRNAPLGLAKDDSQYSWHQAVEIVSKAFYNFHEIFGRFFHKLLDEGRVDGEPRSGKRAGAYCMLGTTSCQPVVFTNFLGNVLDVTTLAHECGHAVHGILKNKQPYLLQQPAMTICETASIFGEMLVFQDLLEKCQSEEGKLELLMGKLNDIMNSVVRQMSFDEFEEQVHESRKASFVSEKQMSEMWMRSIRNYYGDEGDAFTSYDNAENLWCYVPHFHELPFYVYAYAFADLVVGTLYSLYKDRQLPDFKERFLELLSAGGSKPFVELLQPFGLDGASDSFWLMALEGYVEPLLSEAERIAATLSF